MSTDTASPVYEWEDVGNADDYELRIFDRQVGALVHRQIYVSSAICSNGDCSVLPDGVAVSINGNHFWQIRARNTGGWNTLSDPIRFTYADEIPGEITPLAPLVSTDTASPAYEWEDVGNADDYELRIFDRQVRALVHRQVYPGGSICSGGTCSVVPTGVALNISSDHFWQIRARNSGGWNTLSDPIRFSYADQVPGEITPLAPLVSVDTASPAFEWQDVGNADDYELRVFDRQVGALVLRQVFASSGICAGGVCGIVPSSVVLNFSDDHFWQIRARNSGGWNTLSAPIRFAYADEIPGVVTALAPLVSTDTASPAYEWEDLGNVDDYELRVFDRQAGALVHRQVYTSGSICSAGTCSVVPAGVVLSEGSNDFWQIRARNSGGWNTLSDPIRFSFISE